MWMDYQIVIVRSSYVSFVFIIVTCTIAVGYFAMIRTAVFVVVVHALLLVGFCEMGLPNIVECNDV
jgi:hypothetical protein